MKTDLYPAIDLLGGRVVRLRKGDYDDETVYGDDAIVVARDFVAAGARWIHVVDLDAARSGSPVNRPIVSAIAEAVRGSASVQTGGGVRTLADVGELVAAGVARAVMGSAAVADPALVARASELLPIAVGLDHRGGDIAIHGWTEDSGLRLDDAYARFPTAAMFVVTDIGRDGMLEGPDVRGLSRSIDLAAAPVIASGGVASLADIDELARLEGLGGIITGKALYEGRFGVAEALATIRAAPAEGAE